MTYDIQKKVVGREPVTLVELDLDFCDNTYGIPPCMASLSAFTNVLLWSEDFSNAAWTKTRSSISANATTAPDGTMTADKLVEDATAANNHLASQTSTTIAPSALQSFTMFFKQDSRDFAALQFADNASTGNAITAFFDLVNGVVLSVAGIGNALGAAATIVDAKNGWWKCTITGTANTSGTTTLYRAFLSATGSSTVYNGDGTSGLFIWGAQAVSGAPVTSYVKSEAIAGMALQTGVQKCFNTFNTCQDKANYSRGTKTYKFCSPNAKIQAASLGLVPNVEKVAFVGTRIENRGIGLRAGVTVTFKDHPHHDRGYDPYVAERSYDPSTTGSFWGKLRARNQYYWARTMRVKTGYITDPFDAANFEERTYIIDKVTGPDADGTVTIVGKDPLRLTDDTRSLAPIATSGLLLNPILVGDTSLTLYPAGIGLDYSASGFLVIGNEVIQYASKTGDVFNTLTRGTRGTIASGHDADDKVQQALTFDNVRVEEVVRILLEDYANIPSSFIPIADWNANADLWLSNALVYATIIKPEGVQTLLEELARDFMFLLWWDEETAKINFEAVAPALPGSTIPRLNDNAHFLMDSLRVEDQIQDRVSRVLVYYGLLDPTKGISDTTNYRGLYVNIDADAEGPNAYNKESVYEIRSRFIPSFDSAITVGGRTINRFKNVLKKLSFELDARDKDVWTGDVLDVETRAIQDVTGLPLRLRMQVTEVKETKIGHTFSYSALDLGGPKRIGLISPDLYLGSPFPNYSAATQELKDKYAFISPNNGVFSDGTDAYIII